MTQDEYIQHIRNKNPVMYGTRISISTEQFERALRQAWDMGAESVPKKDAFADLFGTNPFGRK